jgi:hypothetical protein
MWNVTDEEQKLREAAALASLTGIAQTLTIEAVIRLAEGKATANVQTKAAWVMADAFVRNRPCVEGDTK